MNGEKTKAIKPRNIIALTILLIMVITSAVWAILDRPSNDFVYDDACIYLYGETHGSKQYYSAELESWKKYYEKDNMRVLFVELPYYTAQYINVWMKADDDTILDQLFEDIKGTASATKDYYDFFKNIKADTPETVFVGTDVGHQYAVTGKRYLSYICEDGKYNQAEVDLVNECIRQGEEWEKVNKGNNEGFPLREKYMIENFEKFYNLLSIDKIMGIYGSYHIDQNNKEIMAGALAERYKDKVNSYYVYNQILYPKSYRFGITLVGLLFILVLYIPNIIAGFFLPKELKELSKQENKILKVLELVGQVAVTVSALVFADYNPRLIISKNGVQFPGKLFFLFMALFLMLLYILFWTYYFLSKRRVEDLYFDFAGIPFAGASLPVLIALFLGIYGGNLIMILSAIILGIGHIGIAATNLKKSL